MAMNLVYAGLLLHSAGKELNEENVKKIAAATGESVDEASIKAFVTAVKDVNIDEAIEKAVMPVAAAAPAAGGDSKEEKKEKESPEDAEKKAEEAAEGLGSLFG